jgi:hypothetical protein
VKKYNVVQRILRKEERDKGRDIESEMEEMRDGVTEWSPSIREGDPLPLYPLICPLLQISSYHIIFLWRSSPTSLLYYDGYYLPNTIQIQSPSIISFSVLLQPILDHKPSVHIFIH